MNTTVPLQRISDYWTQRAHDFSTVRQNELRDGISDRWLGEMAAYFPAGKALDVLDAGTGTGYFAILLAGAGHTLTGIDLTPAMLAQAEETASRCSKPQPRHTRMRSPSSVRVIGLMISQGP